VSFSSRGTIEYGKGGYLTASYPWGHLESDPDRLYLTAPVFGEMTFVPGDVVAVERFVRIPVLKWGVQIRHVKPDVARVIHSLASRGRRLCSMESEALVSFRAQLNTSCV